MSEAQVRRLIRARLADGSFRDDFAGALVAFEGAFRLRDVDLAVEVVNACPELGARVRGFLRKEAAAQAIGEVEGYVRDLVAGVIQEVDEHLGAAKDREEQREADRRLFMLLVRDDLTHPADAEHAERLRRILETIESDDPLWPMWFAHLGSQGVWS